MAAASYGSYAPQEDQPSGMEVALANKAYSGYADSPAEAQTALDQYWLERQVNKADYADQLQQQHEFAKQQLAQQMYEANLKGLYEAGKTPGMLQIMATSPEYAAVFGGADPGAIASVIGQQQESQQATNLGHTGSFLSGAAAGGHVFPTLTNLPGMGGQDSSRYIGTPAEINAAARLAAARIGASKQDTANLPGVNIPLPTDLFGEGGTVSVKIDPRAPPAQQILQWKTAIDQLRTGLANQQPAPTTPVTPPPVPKRVGMGATTSAGARLPPAQQDTGSAPVAPPGQPAHSYVSTATKEGQAAQISAMRYLDTLKRTDPRGYQLLAPRGNVIPLVKGPNGTMFIQGNDKNYYPVPPQAG